MEDFEAAEGEKPSDPRKLMCPLPPSPLQQGEERVKLSGSLHQIQVIKIQYTKTLMYSPAERSHTYAEQQRSKGCSALQQEQTGNKDVWLQSNYPFKEITINSELPNYREHANLGNH